MNKFFQQPPFLRRSDRSSILRFHAWRVLTMAIALSFAPIEDVRSQEPPPKTEDEIEKVEDLFGDFDAGANQKPADAPKKDSEKKEPEKKADSPAEAKPAEAPKADDKPADKPAEEPAKPAAKRKPRVVAKPKEEKPADPPADEADEFGAVEGRAVVAADVVMAMNDVDILGEPHIAKCLQVEKAFLRRVCKLNDEQEKKLSTLDIKWAMKKAVPGGNRMVNGVMIGGENMVPASMIRRYLEKAFTKELSEVLDESQKEKYQQEITARRNFDSEAQLEAAIALLDSHLVLREEQCESLREALRKSFRSDADPRMYFYNTQYLPQFPDASILKHLDPEQKDIYRALQKVNFGFSHEDLGDVIEK